ncbi:MAG: MarR family transcriptional regulator [Nocardioides sp.]|nr:MarR family transcriptional regulator [Nocardioides sp.]
MVDDTPRELPTGLLMFLAHRWAEDRVFEALAASGHGAITRSQGRLLAGLDPEGSRLTTLAERARVSKQTALALVDRLVEAGYVVRVPDPADGRARLVRLTALGESLLPHARAAEEQVEAAWEQALGVEAMAALREALERLRPVVDTG